MIYIVVRVRDQKSNSSPIQNTQKEMRNVNKDAVNRTKIVKPYKKSYGLSDSLTHTMGLKSIWFSRQLSETYLVA
jgi:hypothetical protein